MSYIVNPARSTILGLRGAQPLGVPIYSPDGNHFLIVTQRGVVSSNALQGTIWEFDQQSVVDYNTNKSSEKPSPRKLATLQATSNTPVIYDVRWIDGSKRVAFLGKDGSPYQRLFLLDADTGVMSAMTKDKSYVTAYDICGDTVAYTALIANRHPVEFDTDLIDVGDMNLFQLIYRNEVAIEDVEEMNLLKYPSSLHVQKGGNELPVNFMIGARSLQLFVPTLALSPDAKFLITVAPVYEISKAWEQYQPRYEQLRLKSGSVEEGATAYENVRRPEQYVIVDLQSGFASSLVDAPAARDLGYFNLATEAFWLQDHRYAVLTNTYKPFTALADSNARAGAADRPAVMVVDVSTGEVHAYIDIREPPPFGTGLQYWTDSIEWEPRKCELTLRYKGFSDGPAPPAESYALRSGQWVRTRETDKHQNARPQGEVMLTVQQNLNEPPRLWEQARGRTGGHVLWDPNPQLESLRIGKASVYHWRDKNGKEWSGILVLPPGLHANLRYPLVIQTHGYESDKFFSDGEFTTGSGGRALVAKGVILLQMDEGFAGFSRNQLSSIEEGQDNLNGFEGAIDRLVTDGLVDGKRVGVIGFSRTCFHVLYALTHRPEMFRVASITDGVNFSYFEYMLASGSGRDEYVKESEAINGGIPFGDNLLKWIRSAPGFNLDKVEAPLLITALERPELLSQWEIYSALTRLKKPVDMLWWWRGNTPHILVQPAHRYASQQSAVDWFCFWLKSEEDPNPVKGEQYARWHELRKLQEQNDRQPQQANPPSVH